MQPNCLHTNSNIEHGVIGSNILENLQSITQLSSG